MLDTADILSEEFERGIYMDETIKMDLLQMYSDEIEKAKEYLVITASCITDNLRDYHKYVDRIEHIRKYIRVLENLMADVESIPGNVRDIKSVRILIEM